MKALRGGESLTDHESVVPGLKPRFSARLLRAPVCQLCATSGELRELPGRTILPATKQDKSRSGTR